MHHIQYNKLHYYIPSSWLEVPQNKRAGLYMIMNDNINYSFDARIDIPLVLVRAFIYLSGMTMEQLEAWRNEVDDDIIFQNYLDQVVGLLDWLFETVHNEDDNSTAQTFAMKMYSCPVDELKVYDETGAALYLYPPNDDMNNITLGELLKVFSCVEALHGDGDRISADPSQYDELIASIYRPLNPSALPSDRDKRIPLVGLDHLVEGRKQYLFQIHETVKEMIMYWAQCIRQRYVTNYANLFQAAKEEGEKVGNDYGWAGLIMALSKDITQIRDVQNQSAEDAFVYLSYLEDERKKSEKEIERQKQKHGTN